MLGNIKTFFMKEEGMGSLWGWEAATEGWGEGEIGEAVYCSKADLKS